MSGYPPDYDPKGRSLPRNRQKRLPPPAPPRDPDAPGELPLVAAFGRKVVPPADRVEYPPICQESCRLTSMGECPARCRLMARS